MESFSYSYNDSIHSFIISNIYDKEKSIKLHKEEKELS